MCKHVHGLMGNHLARVFFVPALPSHGNGVVDLKAGNSASALFVLKS